MILKGEKPIVDFDFDYVILEFGEVDDKFISFVQNTLCDYDMLKHENIYKIE